MKAEPATALEPAPEDLAPPGPALRCLNCDAVCEPTARFCAGCGQRTDTARLSLSDVVRDLMHSFVNVERGPLAFAWALLVRPGGVARDYVLGRRRRHYGPFATLVVIVGVTALLINLSAFPVLSEDGLPSRPTALLQSHFNLLLLVQLPLLGACGALMFRHARMTLPEHMVLAAYALSVRAAVIAIVVGFAFLDSARPPGPFAVYGFWAAWYLYYGWAASQFYPGRRPAVWLRGMLVAALGHAAIVGLLFAGSAAYEALVPR
jgi:hypothetical protein